MIPNGDRPAALLPARQGAARRELGIPVEGKITVCVGHIAPVHGQHLIVDAMARPDAPGDVHTYLVGGGPDYEALRADVERRGLGGRVTFVGPVPHARVPLWFSAANVSLHPGASAGSPNAVLESLACGTPCVVTDLPEFREVVRAPEQGRAIARTPEAIAAAVAAMADLPSAGSRPQRSAARLVRRRP